MEKQISLYERVVEITTEYLGPPAERFITRQIRNHLRKNPEELAKKDLKELIDWICVGMGFLSNSEVLINEYIDKLLLLTENTRSKPVKGYKSR